MDKVKVGIIGSQFVAHLHAEAFGWVPNAEVVAVASPNREHVTAFAERFGIPRALTDYRDLLNIDEIDLITIAVPNDLHAQVCIDAAKAGKHVVCEKPLCLSLEEADAMISACREAGVKLMYAEELCFAPKYVRAKQLVDEGALGDIFVVKQSEEHYGPHSPWFWDVRRSGGGVLLDMGCHSIAFCRWVLGNKPIESVYAAMGTFVHGDKTIGEDHAICVLRFEGGAIGLCENSWGKAGGVDDKCEIYGSLGNTRADLLRGSSLVTYSEVGYGYAVEKATTTQGWTFTMFEETWNYGFPQEMQHFVNCVARDEQPMLTGEDGKAVLEAILAAYHSAGTGQEVKLPWTPPSYERPIELWRGPLSNVMMPPGEARA
ncbi:MAG TPA: Gfo/Idh/MocA family oxidoreductase [Thermomicrobiales bacterium]